MSSMMTGLWNAVGFMPNGVFILTVTETGKDWEQMGCMKLCGSFHITPEEGQGLRPIVPYYSSPGPCLGPGFAECEYTIKWSVRDRVIRINEVRPWHSGLTMTLTFRLN